MAPNPITAKEDGRKDPYLSNHDAAVLPLRGQDCTDKTSDSQRNCGVPKILIVEDSPDRLSGGLRSAERVEAQQHERVGHQIDFALSDRANRGMRRVQHFGP